MYIKQKTAPQNSPLERGRGCVTPRHSFLKTKAVTEADRYRLATLSPIYSNTSTYAALLTVTHPFVPSQEGNSQHPKPLTTNKKQAPEPPRPKEGSGVCYAQAKPPKNQKHPPKAKKHDFTKQ